MVSSVVVMAARQKSFGLSRREVGLVNNTGQDAPQGRCRKARPNGPFNPARRSRQSGYRAPSPPYCDAQDRVMKRRIFLIVVLSGCLAAPAFANVFEGRLGRGNGAGPVRERPAPVERRTK